MNANTQISRSERIIATVLGIALFICTLGAAARLIQGVCAASRQMYDDQILSASYADMVGDELQEW